MPIWSRYKPYQSTPPSGFTIVELLIVIVIIGVLAALVIVSYNGIQARANNSQTISSVGVYAKAMTQYAIDNGRWPSDSTATTPYWRCLGEHSNPCGQSSSTSPSCASPGLHCSAYTDTTLNNSLKSYYNGMTITPPSIKPVTINIPGVGDVQYRGAVVYVSSPTATTFRIRYYLAGSNTNCDAPSGFRGIQDLGYTGDTSCYIDVTNPN